MFYDSIIRYFRKTSHLQNVLGGAKIYLGDFMKSVNRDLKEYIEESIFPIYEKNDLGHGTKHVNYVINRSLKVASQFHDLNIDMIYTIAAFHDIAHHIDKDHHEVLSATLFYENNTMKQFFNEEQRRMIKEAIEDHRASLEWEPRSDYGKIISLADKNIDIVSALQRTHSYTLKHYPTLSLEQAIDRAYEHIASKFGKNGYAKVYIEDEDYHQFKNDIENLLQDKYLFSKKYMEVNGIIKVQKSNQ